MTKATTPLQALDRVQAALEAAQAYPEGQHPPEVLNELADAGHTILLITHDRSVAAQAWRVIEIHDGRIVSDSQSRHTADQDAAPAQPLTIPTAKDAPHQTATASWWADLLEAARSAWRGMVVNRPLALRRNR